MWLALSAFVTSFLGLAPSELEQVQARGQLRVLTRHDPTSYYQGANGPVGLEYELAQRFAEYLGVELRLEVAEDFASILPRVERGEVDVAAAGLAITPQRQRRVRFGPPYQSVEPQLIYRRGSFAPTDLNQLDGDGLEVLAGSSHVERLRALHATYPRLEWRETVAKGTQELLDLVHEGLVEFTVANSHEVTLKQLYYPELKVAFNVGGPQLLAWAFPQGRDNTLVEQARDFFAELQSEGELLALIERYYGHIDRLDYVSVHRFVRAAYRRLPSYQRQFQDAAADSGWDWRLLAAVGYQESHWDPAARSPTGVRGLMMLTRATATQVGVEDRLNPEQSIAGGARYLRRVKRRLSRRVAEPDRTWLTLAAYNVGYGHLQDARRLAEEHGADPDRWADVRHFLPLLSDEAWYSKTRYGFARGQEPVDYVENVRSYYDILVWLTESREPPEQAPTLRALHLEPAAL
jgi:membrane-bound lytic murein transglycosylase F